MDENQQPSVQQATVPEYTRGRERNKSRVLHRVGAGKWSTSITTDTNTSNTSFATPSTT